MASSLTPLPSNISPAAVTSQTGQSVPYNPDVEAALLGALLRNNKAYEQISDITRADHFYQGGHAQIYILITRLLDEGRIANEDTLTHHAESDDILKHLGGADYISQLADQALSIISVHEYAQLLRDLYLKRELIKIGENCVIDASRKLEHDATTQIEAVEQQLFSLAEHQESDKRETTLGESAKLARDSINQAMKNGGKITGIATGLDDLDQHLGGLQKSDLLVLAGRPSMGKTAMALNIGYNVAKNFKQQKDDDGKMVRVSGGRVGVFSLEMSSEQLASRLLAAACEIRGDSLKRGDITQEQYSIVARTANEMEKMPLFIDDSSFITVNGIRQRARRIKRKHGLDLLIIDYAQLIQSGADFKAENRVQEVSYITRQLKALARELNIPIMLLSQLSRAVESREPPIPQLSDLRDSGAIEQDADLVAFIYRPEYYLQRRPPERRENESSDKFDERYQSHQQRLEESRNIAQIHLAKHRHGAVGTVELFFNPEYALFSNLTKKKYE